MTRQFIVIQKSHDEEASSDGDYLFCSTYISRVSNFAPGARFDAAQGPPGVGGRQGRSLLAGTVRGYVIRTLQKLKQRSIRICRPVHIFIRQHEFNASAKIGHVP